MIECNPSFLIVNCPCSKFFYHGILNYVHYYYSVAEFKLFCSTISYMIYLQYNYHHCCHTVTTYLLLTKHVSLKCNFCIQKILHCLISFSPFSWRLALPRKLYFFVTSEYFFRQLNLYARKMSLLL